MIKETSRQVHALNIVNNGEQTKHETLGAIPGARIQYSQEMQLDIYIPRLCLH